MKGKKIQEKDKINLQLLNKKKVQKLKEKGITLIALVVTIIILLILAGVTLNMALSGDGLFSRARNAADKYKKAQEDETKLISEIGKEMNSEYVGAKVTWNYFEKKEGKDAYKVEASKSGAEEDQKFTTETMKWRIWDYDGTIVRIISEKPTTNQLTLGGAAGYNNGVYLINEICRQCYGQYEADGEKKTGISVANLRRSDIEAVSNYDYTKFKHKDIGNGGWNEVLDDENEGDLIFYGEEKKYGTDLKIPLIWKKYDKNWTYKYDKSTKKGVGDKSTEVPWEQEYENEQEIEAEDTSPTEFTQSYYYHNYLNKQEEFNDSRYYDLLFKDENENYFNSIYWLSGRCVNLFEGSFYLGLNLVEAKDEDCHVQGSYACRNDRCWWKTGMRS